MGRRGGRWLFQKGEFGQHQGGAGAAALIPGAPWVHRRADAPLLPPADWRERIKFWAEDINLVPDLGQHLFSVDWFRGLATCMALCILTIKLSPGFVALPAPSDAVQSEASYDEVRSQMLTPLALGADSGKRMAATDKVRGLLSTPERPFVNVLAAVGEGDSFTRALSRAGVSNNDIGIVSALIGMDVADGRLSPGTRLNITLGRRANPNLPRPLDALTFRARLDLGIEIRRSGGTLDIKRTPIKVDSTPLRIRGVVSDSLYSAARAAGASPAAIQEYLRVLTQQMSLDQISAGDSFDIIIANRRAATGENEQGALLFAGYQAVRGKKLDMLKWNKDGQEQWFEASGVGERRAGLASPVAGHLTSRFGMRFHPVLGYSRMHAGVDFRAPYGAPIYAVTDGIVTYAGRHGGHGNFVQLKHAGNLGTGYAHMSRIAASVGERVRQGQVIGYIGSTGLSTGPHLHYEVYRNNQPVNPLSVKFATGSLLSGKSLAAFKARLNQLKGLNNGPQDTQIGKAALNTPIVSR
jgi:murein DD-endopeptidase MepM/ murein hydrolase activator NlpD